MSTYTDSLGLELITPGSQAGLWGNTTNNTFNLIDQAITGVTPISFAAASGSTYTLTDFNGAADESRSAVLNITGTAIGANTIVIPNKQKTYYVRNATGQDIVVKTLVGTTPCTVGSGYNLPVFCDGNNNVFLAILAPGAGTLTVTGGGTGVTTFGSGGFVKSSGGANALTSSATVSLTSEVSGTLPVSNGGTGVTSFTSGAVLVGNGSGSLSTITASTAGYVLTWNGSQWIAAASATGVSSLATGTGLSVNSPTGNVTMSLANSGVTPGSYTSANVTVDTYGRVTAISNGSGGGVTSFNSRTGTVTPQSSDYSSFYGSLANTASNTWASSNTYNGTVTFTNTVTSSAWNMASNVSMYYAGGQVAISVSGGGLIVTSAGDISITGSTATKASGTTWANPSDSRLKDNVQDYTKGLSTLTQIQPKSWTFNGKGGSQAGTHGRGVIADQIESVLPDSVTTYKAKLDESDAVETDIKMFNADEIIWILVNSVKELKAEVDALKAAK